jgi:flagellar hook assembly protein FlgD
VHPNPFNPQTTVEYSLSAVERVSINIYDARGKLVFELVNKIMPVGEHRVTWNGVDRDGRTVGSGIYFVKMAAGPHVDTHKIVLLK